MWRFLGITVTSLALLVGAAIPAAAAELMRVTFVRHGESAGNASGLIDTSTPGPVLTPLGQQQAQAVVGTLGVNNYDAIYGSSMVRTQLTAAPMSQYLRLPVQVLPGLQEIEAGVFEGTPEADAQRGYGLYPLGWTFPGAIPGIPVEVFNKNTFMPGTNLNGHGFDARVDGALQTMYDRGDRNPVVFSHGGTIMFWTMMNADNLTVAQKLQLLQTARLDNTDYVVIEGNPEDGWTLVNWNGQQFAPEPTVEEEVALQTRTLTRQLEAAAQQVSAALATGNIKTILTAIKRAADDAAYSVVKFNRAVNAKLNQELDQDVSPLAAVDDSAVAPATETAKEPTSVTDTAAPADQSKPLSAATKSEAVETPKKNQRLAATAAPVTTGEKDGTEASLGSAGATDLSDGNKVAPVARDTRRPSTGNDLPDASDDTGDEGTSAAQNRGGAGEAADQGGDQNSDAA